VIRLEFDFDRLSVRKLSEVYQLLVPARSWALGRTGRGRQARSKTTAIYSRVSSERQKEEGTITSKVAALIEYAERQGYSVPPEWIFRDE